jgi:hypothetical protein
VSGKPISRPPTWVPLSPVWPSPHVVTIYYLSYDEREGPRGGIGAMAGGQRRWPGRPGRERGRCCPPETGAAPRAHTHILARFIGRGLFDRRSAPLIGAAVGVEQRTRGEERRFPAVLFAPWPAKHRKFAPSPARLVATRRSVLAGATARAGGCVAGKLPRPIAAHHARDPRQVARRVASDVSRPSS